MVREGKIKGKIRGGKVREGKIKGKIKEGIQEMNENKEGKYNKGKIREGKIREREREGREGSKRDGVIFRQEEASDGKEIRKDIICMYTSTYK
eukprot:170529-Amorphochlora_amoeboformis.AAC.1